MCASDRSTSRAWALALLGCSLVLGSTAALAQSAAAGDEQVRRLRLQMRQLQSSMQETQEKAEADRQAAQQALSAAQTELSREKAAAASAGGRLAALSRELAAARAEGEALEKQLGELKAALAQGSEQQAACRTELTVTRQELGAANTRLNGRLKQCVAYNHELHGIGQDLLQRYENKGLGEVLGASEPFIQGARVRLENLSAELRGKLEARHLSDAK